MTLILILWLLTDHYLSALIQMKIDCSGQVLTERMDGQTHIIISIKMPVPLEPIPNLKQSHIERSNCSGPSSWGNQHILLAILSIVKKMKKESKDYPSYHSNV